MKQQINSLSDVIRLCDKFKAKYLMYPTALYVGRTEFEILDSKLHLILLDTLSDTGEYHNFCIGMPVFEVNLSDHFEFVIGPKHAIGK